jgi:drug/metabolite transporter (DMT)-like permease
MGLTAALIAAALFGSVSTIAKPVLATVDPFVLSSLVYLISAMLFSAMIAVRNYTAAASSQLTTESSFSKRRYYLIVLITSIIGATIAPAMFFFGLRQTTASDTALLANGETIFSIMLAILFFKEKLRMFGYLAALMVLAGLVVVNDDVYLGATALWGLDNNICRIITSNIDILRLVQLKSVIGGSILLFLQYLYFIFH